MKTILALAVALFGLSFVPAAEAGHPSPRLAYRLSCGHSVYAYPTVIGYERCGTPVYRWVNRHPGCSCASRSHSHYSVPRTPSYCPPSRSSSYRHGYSYNRGYGYGSSGHSYRSIPRCGSGSHLSFSFRR